MRTTFLLFSILFLSTVVQAQNTLKGRVISAENGETLPRASVYLSNTTLGTVTDLDGNFELAKIPELPFNLNISYVGYHTQVVEINQLSAEPIEIKLKPDVKMLGEVVVNADNDRLWAQFGAQFLKDFIGYSEFAEEVELQNPEDLILNFDQETQVLSVYASEPLVILNKALGYKIKYWLDAYEYSFRNGQIFYKGYPFFEDLALAEKSKRKLKTWRKNRNSAYNGSLNHFMQALYHNDLKAQGFKVDLMDRVTVSQYYEKTEKKVDTLFYNNASVEYIYNTIKSKMDNPKYANIFLNNIRKWYANPEAKTYRFTLCETRNGKREEEAFEFEKDDLNPEKIVTKRYPVDPEIEKQARNGKIAVITAQNVNAADSLVEEDGGLKSLDFDKYWYVTYLKEKEEKAFQQRSLRFKEYVAKDQTSIISITEPEGLKIFSNGHFSPPSGLLTEGYWAFEKVDKLLPLDFTGDLMKKSVFKNQVESDD